MVLFYHFSISLQIQLISQFPRRFHLVATRIFSYFEVDRVVIFLDRTGIEQGQVVITITLVIEPTTGKQQPLH